MDGWKALPVHGGGRGSGLTETVPAELRPQAGGGLEGKEVPRWRVLSGNERRPLAPDLLPEAPMEQQSHESEPWDFLRWEALGSHVGPHLMSLSESSSFSSP